MRRGWWRNVGDWAIWPRSRRNELAGLRLELSANPGPQELVGEELALAVELRELRVGLVEAFGELRACRTCARGHAAPRGRWDGGYCCGTRTEQLFSHDEIAALRAGGTTASDLRPPYGAQAGCAFRGRSGCSLAPVDRPGICIRHVCPALVEELRARGDLGVIRVMTARMSALFAAYQRVRRRGDAG